MLLVIFFTLPCYCLGVFTWQFTPDQAKEMTSTPTMTIPPFRRTETPAPGEPSRTVGPAATNTFPPTSVPTGTASPTLTFTPLPTWTMEPSPTNTEFIFDTPTNLPSPVETVLPSP